MHLTKLFNFKYLIQNLKKSKGALAVFLGLVPILNFLIFLVQSLNSANTLLLSLSELSGINIVGTFVIPVIMSYCLFGYLFKKKSVDFVGSMPIDRKAIFISNTVGGIVLIIVMNLLNVILLSIVANVFSGFLFPLRMVLDYFVLWTITYIFIFTVSNLAIVLTGNMITSIVVTCLMLFLVPFTKDYIFLKSEENVTSIYRVKCSEAACEPDTYFCADSECTKNLANDIYQTYIQKNPKAPNHIAPYSYISNFLFYNYSEYSVSFYNSISLIKMLIASIVCFVIGLIVFIKRKMEICETSFKSMVMHNAVKALVLVPVLCIMFEFLTELSFTIIIFVALIIIYYLIYDLITMRKISLQKRSIFTFLALTITIVWGIIGINYFTTKEEQELIYVSEIDSVAVTLDDEYYEEIFVGDKDLINYIMKLELANYDYQAESEEEFNNVINYTFKIDDTTYSSSCWVSNEAYNHILESLNANTHFLSKLRSVDDDIKAIAVNDFVIEDTDEILNVITKELRLKSLPNYIASFNTTFPVEVKLVSYENHDLIYKTIPAGLSKELENKIAETQNAALIKTLNVRKTNYVYIHLNNFLYIEEISNRENSDVIIDYLLDYSVDEIINYIKENKDVKIDLNKQYICLEVYINDTVYQYVTNDIASIRNILIKKHQKLLNTEEYNNLLNNLESDAIYYD